MAEPPDTGQPYVFLSYTSPDRERVLALADRLIMAGIQVWVDRRDIAGGSSWDTSIVQAIAYCTVFALTCSARSLVSPNVQQEARLAWEERRPILPLLLESVTIPADLRYPLAGRQWVELHDRPETAWLPDVLLALERLGVHGDVADSPTSTQQHSVPGGPVIDHAEPRPTGHATNLPVALTPLIGREDELPQIAAALHESRLVTLTGPGGTGKTRLALAAAERSFDFYPDGVWFVDLTAVVDAGLLPATLAQVLGVRPSEGQPLEEALHNVLRPKRALLVFDNFEQLLEGVAFLRGLLTDCPRLTLLVTSRIVLRLPGEKELAIPPLSLPNAGNRAMAAAEASPAVQLFVQRARDVRPDFALTAENATAVVEICRRLDGLPLAIELAAPRVKLLPPQQLLARLEQRLKLLTGGSRALPERQRTLRDAIQWSYDLLTADEQRFFCALGVFAGGCTLEAAEAECSADGDLDGFEGVASLVDKSLLVQRDGPDGEPRFHMLATIREFALERLQAAGELAAMQERHAGWLVELAEAAAGPLESGERDVWLLRLAAEQDNIRATLAWSLEHGAIELGLRVVGALAFWYWLRLPEEGLRWVEQLLERADDSIDLAVRAQAYFTAGYVALVQWDTEAGKRYLDQSVKLWRTIGNDRGLGVALGWQGMTYFGTADMAPGLAAAEEGAACLRRAGAEWRLGWVLAILGGVFGQRAAPEEAVAIFSRLGDPLFSAIARGGLGMSLLAEGNVAAARAVFLQALPTLRQYGDHWDASAILFTLANNERILGRHGAALAHQRETIAEVLANGDIAGAAVGARLSGQDRLRLDDPTHGVRLIAGGRRWHEPRALVWLTADVQRAETEMLEAAKEQLGEEAFADAWAAGERMSRDELIALALGGDTAIGTPSS